ncbi:MAG: hypothetical protein ACR2M7_00740, partial [Bdellovibrionales bacterium]
MHLFLILFFISHVEASNNNPVLTEICETRKSSVECMSEIKNPVFLNEIDLMNQMYVLSDYQTLEDFDPILQASFSLVIQKGSALLDKCLKKGTIYNDGTYFKERYNITYDQILYSDGNDWIFDYKIQSFDSQSSPYSMDVSKVFGEEFSECQEYSDQQLVFLENKLTDQLNKLLLTKDKGILKEIFKTQYDIIFSGILKC